MADELNEAHRLLYVASDAGPMAGPAPGGGDPDQPVLRPGVAAAAWASST